MTDTNKPFADNPDIRTLAAKLKQESVQSILDSINKAFQEGTIREIKRTYYHPQ